MPFNFLRRLRKSPTIDLHTHTNYSDGRYSPAEVIAGAARRGIRVLAITDHDTLDGSLSAAPLATEANIELIPAIEITTRWPEARLPREDANVDVLGYFVDPQNQEFATFVAALSADMQWRTAESAALLTAAGYPISFEEVQSINPRYVGALQLIETTYQKGYAASFREAAMLVNDVCSNVRDAAFTVQAAIEEVHRAGGLAVLAHPAVVHPNNERLTEPWLRGLVEAGLDGIEIYHHRLDHDDRAYFLRLARELNLVVTGGSDMHGWHRGLDELGTQPVTEAMVEQMRARQRDRQNRPPASPGSKRA